MKMYYSGEEFFLEKFLAFNGLLWITKIGQARKMSAWLYKIANCSRIIDSRGKVNTNFLRPATLHPLEQSNMLQLFGFLNICSFLENILCLTLFFEKLCKLER